MKKILAIIIGLIIIISGVALVYYFQDDGNTVTITGYVKSDDILDNVWEIHITGKEFGGNLESLDLLETGAITIKGVLYPDPAYYPEITGEAYEAECNTGKTLDTLFGETVGFKLTFKRIVLHNDKYEDGMWYKMNFEIHETTGGIPFTDIRWGDHKISSGTTSIYLKFQEEIIDPGEGETQSQSGILTTVDKYTDLLNGETQYYVRVNLYPSNSIRFDMPDESTQIALYDQLYLYKTKEVKISYVEYDNGKITFGGIEEI